MFSGMFEEKGFATMVYVKKNFPIEIYRPDFYFYGKFQNAYGIDITWPIHASLSV